MLTKALSHVTNTRRCFDRHIITPVLPGPLGTNTAL